MHISRIDLNLFTVFEAIYTEGSVTRASQKLNLTQPAISHALGRLRTMFDDPLFIRQGHAMVSTPLARSMIEPVRRSLRGLEVTLNGLDRFDPATTPKQFKLALRDVLEATILPPLIQRVSSSAPLVDLAASQVDRRDLESELAAGTLDGAIDVLLPLSSDILHTRIDQDSTVVVARKGHPAIDGALDLATYLKQDHILASSRRKGLGLEDFELSRFGVERRIRLRCQHYFAACRVVSQTDLILTMPGRYARIANQQFDNQILPFPLEVPAFDVFLYWHANVDNDPANRWLREQIMQSFGN
ncbi:MAG TPA: LysR family transcriptional regulator [Noviherbaspirillum sp.]|jgi:DNA-binding transcriptional LysR family regulator|uniref:LysR family transcriptional regulator n=1 Tax=Noviherbaspirillum sp. TaxID=1926288 RepID=UPI002DDD8246|nr:LysR family transcriptional regulator [Noviherbaspirillum sp.]HEV2612245.1 LysR family transcriptional regulator [Noviherbaspirillum sp.]